MHEKESKMASSLAQSWGVVYPRHPVGDAKAPSAALSPRHSAMTLSEPKDKDPTGLWLLRSGRAVWAVGKAAQVAF